MATTAELLQQYLVPNIAPETLKELVSLCEMRTYKAGEIIYREHEDSTYMLIVHSGQVDVQYLHANGRRETLDKCRTGDVLVWSALVSPCRTNSIGICRAETEVLAVDGVKLRALCEKDTAFGYRMMSNIASVIRRRLQAARREIVALRE
ncbi:MAG TPA: hypothetical protein DEB39_07750 [Planctomycetaceae bacterium]|nr:hypothetical protein [Planctomycetaceae bacterium]